MLVEGFCRTWQRAYRRRRRLGLIAPVAFVYSWVEAHEAHAGLK